MNLAIFKVVKIDRSTILGIMWGLFFLSLHYQRIVLFEIPETSAYFKPSHLLTLLFCFGLFLRLKIIIPPTLIFVYFAFNIGISLWAYSYHGIDITIVNYVFSFIIFFLALYFADQFREAEVLKILRVCICIIFISVFIKLVLFMDAFIYKNYMGIPHLPFFYGGGRNLEATWLAFGVILFLRTKWYYPLLILSFIISILYVSRTATIVNILLLFYPHLSKFWKKPIFFIGSCITALITVAILFWNLSESDLVQRFLAIGSDRGSVGRLGMWEYFDKAFSANPWGYGAGNSMLAIQAFSDAPLRSGNIHNFYMQTLLDFGILGFIILATLCIIVLYREYKTNWINPYGGFILLYLVAAMTQFRGADPILWFIAGIYSAQYAQKNIKQSL